MRIMEEKELSDPVGGNVKYTAIMENGMVAPQNTENICTI
jgi:hypothetical protein